MAGLPNTPTASAGAHPTWGRQIYSCDDKYPQLRVRWKVYDDAVLHVLDGESQAYAELQRLGPATHALVLKAGPHSPTSPDVHTYLLGTRSSGREFTPRVIRRGAVFACWLRFVQRAKLSWLQDP